jgi:hypothetical protein
VIDSIDPETGTFGLLVKKENFNYGKIGVMRRDGSVLVPVKYYSIKTMPEAGIWLAMRPDTFLKVKVAAAILTGADIHGPKEDEDYLNVDVYDASGAVLRSFRAQEDPDVYEETYSYKSKGRDYLVDARTGQAVPQRETETPKLRNGLFKEGGKYGIKKPDGTVGVPPIYEELSSLGGGLFAATREGGMYQNNWGVIDATGKEVIPFNYSRIETSSYPSPATGPLQCFRSNSDYRPDSLWLINRAGRFVTPQDKPYHNLSSIYFNVVGQAKVGCIYGKIDSLCRVIRVGQARVTCNNGNDGTIDPQCREILGNHAGVTCDDSKDGVVDYTGKEVLPCVYDDVSDVLEQREREDKKKDDSEQPKPGAAGGAGAKSAAQLTAKDALYLVERGKLWGLYDGAGKELIPVRYGYISFSNDEPLERQDWVFVGLGGDENPMKQKRGIVNIRTGQTIATSTRAYHVIRFYPDFFLAYGEEKDQDGYKKDVYALLDKKGKELARYDGTLWLKNAGLLAVERDGKYALLDGQGKQIYPFRCTNVWEAAASFVWCRTSEGETLVNNTGREYRIPGGQ